MKAPYLLATTSKTAWLLDPVSGDARIVDSGQGVYYGITFTADSLFVACRRAPVGSDRISQDNVILHFDRELRLAGELRAPWPIRDVHQIFYYEGVLYICSTFDDVIIEYSLNDESWSRWFPLGDGGEGRDAHHINSIFADGQGFLLTGTLPYGWFAKFGRDKLPCADAKRPLGVATHNVWRDGDDVVVCSSDESAIVSESGKLRRLYSRGWVRGVAKIGSDLFVGISQNLVRDIRGESDCMIAAFDSSGSASRTYAFKGFGMLHDIRCINASDDTHNGLVFLYEETVSKDDPLVTPTDSQTIDLSPTAGTLAEGDAKLKELEAQATDRLKLLEESTARADRLERECADLTQQLQGATKRADSLERECSQLRQALLESTTRADGLERECRLLNEWREQIERRDVDIIREGAPIGLIGSGWYDVDRSEKELFRWVRSEARLNVWCVTRSPCALIFDVEPGPAAGNKPFELAAYEGETKVGRAIVVGRGTVDLTIPPSATPAARELTLRCEKTAQTISASNDDRVEAYRIFSLRLERRPPDVVPPGFSLGEGWYALQAGGGETFRWAGAEAIIEAGENANGGVLALDLERGPGIGLGPLTIKITVGSKPPLSFRVDRRRRIEVPLPGRAATIRLQAEGSVNGNSGDPRALRFRAFAAKD